MYFAAQVIEHVNRRVLLARFYFAEARLSQQDRKSFFPDFNFPHPAGERRSG